MEDCGVECLVGRLPAAIKITACQAAPIITINYTIGVKHGNHFEDEVLSEHLCFVIIWIGEEGEDTTHHP